MSRVIIEVTHIDPNVCFECGAPATERHHVVPASLGGTKTIPLCGDCHAKVHDISGNRRNQLGELTKKSLAKRKELIKTQGGFYSKSGRWVTKMGAEKGADTTAAVSASAKAANRRAMDWVKTAYLTQYCRDKWEQGWTYSQIIEDVHRQYEIDPIKYGTREGQKLNKGHLSRWVEMWTGKNTKKAQKKDNKADNKDDLSSKKSLLCKKPKYQLSEKTIQGIQEYSQKCREQKEEWLQRSEACQFVRALYGSYETRYLIASEKIKLFNESYTLHNGHKITSDGQWSTLKDEWGFSNVVTATSEMILFLYEWAQLWLEKSAECMVIKRGYNYIIMPKNIVVSPAQIHKWNKFFIGLKADGVVNIKFDNDNQSMYTFTSEEIANRIIEDMTK